MKSFLVLQLDSVTSAELYHKMVSFLCLFRSCFATALREKEDEQSIERDISYGPTQPGRHRGRRGGNDGNGCLSLTGTPGDDDIQRPRSLHTIAHAWVCTETGSHRGRRHV